MTTGKNKTVHYLVGQMHFLINLKLVPFEYLSVYLHNDPLFSSETIKRQWYLSKLVWLIDDS